MKVLIDIGHPAHVHYFRNVFQIMKAKGHEFFFTARDKEVAHRLLDHYGIHYLGRGKGSRSVFGKVLYILQADLLLYREARKLRPDLFLSFASTYAAHVSTMLGKPHIAFDDTEHAKLEILLYTPFTDVILNPSCFQKHFSKKQVFFDAYMELCYLHPNYFKPDKSVLNLLGVNQNVEYVIMRFVAWDASHDVGHRGLDSDVKRQLIKKMSKKMKVFISSENKLPDEFAQYQIKIPPERLHDALAFASLYIGEGATTASECAMLGTPAIYVNSLNVGYLEEQEKKYQLMFGFRSSDGVLEKAMELIQSPDLKQEFQLRRKKMLADKIDLTAFMIWFLENYPKSFEIMKTNPEYQNRFKNQV